MAPSRDNRNWTRREALEALLKNEPDLAFKWRVRSAFAYLDLQPEDRILDCGCGLGYYLMALSRLVRCRLHGLDRNLASLVFAQGHATGDRVELYLGDIQRLPYKDECFDKVLLVETLEHLEDDLLGLREVWRVLKPGAKAVVSVPYRDYPFLFDPVNWVLERLVGRPIRTGRFAGIWTEHLRLYDREGLLRLVEEAGFEVLDHHMLTHHCLPFTHNLVYGLGKELLLKRKLPRFILDEVDRFHPGAARHHPLNPMTWVIRLIEWIDGFNMRASGHPTFVNIGVKAEKRRGSNREVSS